MTPNGWETPLLSPSVAVPMCVIKPKIDSNHFTKAKQAEGDAGCVGSVGATIQVIGFAGFPLETTKVERGGGKATPKNPQGCCIIH